MPLWPLLLIASVLAADGGLALGTDATGMTWAKSLALAIGAPAIVLLVCAWLMQRAVRAVQATQRARPLIKAERAIRIARVALLVIHILAVQLGAWLFTVRAAIASVAGGSGDWVLIDELVTILPAVLAMLGTWWLYYPVETSLRQALLIRRLDEGLPLHAMPSRSRYVLTQARLHMFLMLGPVLAIVGLTELADRVVAWAMGRPLDAWIAQLASLSSAAVVFIFAPLLARLLLDVKRLAPGELRNQLLALCARHKVRVRDVLIWHTDGAMINAAVMGLFGRLRYVLLTDALLESMEPDELHAVMAHEVGHARKHHLPWMIVALTACVGVAGLAVQAVVWGALNIVRVEDDSMVQFVYMFMAVGQIALGLFLFGWISRRVERQADTFAVQDLSRQGAEHRAHGAMADAAPATTAVPPTQPAASPNAVSSEAVDAMVRALEAVARLNMVDPRRRSWRHGSIAWRQAYLRAIIGRPLNGLPIDRLMPWIHASCVTALLGMAALVWLMDGQDSPQRRPGNQVARAEPSSVVPELQVHD